MINRQVAFASGGMLSAFKPVGDGSHEPRTSSDSKSQNSDSIPQSTSSYSTYYPVITSTASQPWEPAVLIKPHPPTTAVTTATPTKRKATSGKTKVKKKKKQEIDHSGFVPRKIASSSSSVVKNPLLVTPLLAVKKEENEPVKENDDLFSLYDDFDVAPAAAPPTDHTTCSSSIWDSFEATAVQPPKQQSDTSDSEGSCDASSDGGEECLVATPTIDHVSQPVTEVSTSVTESVDEVQENKGSGSLQQPDKAQPVVEERQEGRNERLLRLLGMPMKSFLSAGHQCPLKEHTTVKVTNTGSYLDKPDSSKYCTTDNNQTAADYVTTTVSQVSNDKLPKHSQCSDVKKPDGLSFGLLKKREKLRQATTGQLFDNEDSS